MKKLFVLFIFLFFIVGCGSSNPFVGTWYFDYDGDTGIVHVQGNGTGYVELKEGKEKYSGKYEYDDKKIKVTSDDGLFNFEANYILNDDICVIEEVKFYKDRDTYNRERNNVIRRKVSVDIPDVSGLNYKEAEKILVDKGFSVESMVEEPNKDLEAGLVIRTDPAAGRNRAEGTFITIYVSAGIREIVVEEYIGRNYIEVKELLESYGVNVEIQKIAGYEMYDPSVIVSQSVKVGTHLSDGDKMILYIPGIYDNYPDFVYEGWSVEKIKEFAEKYNLTLSIKYEESSEYPSGTVIKQSRTGKIVNGTTLIITVVK